MTDQQEIAYNGFHNNEDLNMTYQIQMAFKWTGIYSHLYIKETTIVTDDNLIGTSFL